MFWRIVFFIRKLAFSRNKSKQIDVENSGRTLCNAPISDVERRCQTRLATKSLTNLMYTASCAASEGGSEDTNRSFMETENVRMEHAKLLFNTTQAFNSGSLTNSSLYYRASLFIDVVWQLFQMKNSTKIQLNQATPSTRFNTWHNNTVCNTHATSLVRTRIYHTRSATM